VWHGLGAIPAEKIWPTWPCFSAIQHAHEFEGMPPHAPQYEKLTGLVTKPNQELFHHESARITRINSFV
jgi:hypothetical protein